MAKKSKIPKGRSWLEQIFDAKQIAKNGLVRRSVDDVHENASFEILQEMTIENGFHLIETGGQYVILCNTGSLIIHV